MDYSEEDKGKCLTCGLLAKYSLLTQDYFEVSVSDRELGGTPLYQCVPPGFTGVDNARVQCLVRAKNLDDKIRHRATRTHGTDAGVALSVLAEEENCQKWWPHSPGRSPKEHSQDHDMQELELKRQQFELRLFELSQTVQGNSLRTARWNFWATVIFGAIVVVLSIMQLWQARRPAVVNQMPTPQQQIEQPVEQPK